MSLTSNTCEDIGRQMLVYGRRLTQAEMHVRPYQIVVIIIIIIIMYFSSVSPSTAHPHHYLSVCRMVTILIILSLPRSLPSPQVRIDDITAADMRATAGALVLNQHHALAAIGPIANLPSYEEIQFTHRKFNSFRS